MQTNKKIKKITFHFQSMQSPMQPVCTNVAGVVNHHNTCTSMRQSARRKRQTVCTGQTLLFLKKKQNVNFKSKK